MDYIALLTRLRNLIPRFISLRNRQDNGKKLIWNHNKKAKSVSRKRFNCLMIMLTDNMASTAV